MSGYACPLASWRYTYDLVPQVNGTPTTKLGVQDNNSSTSWTGYTGTKLSNAIKIVNGATTGCYAWATSSSGCPTNGRNDAMTADGLARKVLVIMTDGFSQAGSQGLPSGYPTYTTVTGTPTALSAPGSWDDEAIDLAARLKRGPDNNAATTDDNVEIYVVGFFPVPYLNSTSLTNWARSRAAATGTVAAGTHPCPGPTLPTGANVNQFSYASNSVAPGVDEILNNIASSSAGSCDHYFPIAKSEGAQLPQLFRVMAGSIARGRLQ